MAIEEIKKFVAFPGLTPLQPDAHAHPCKRASLSDHPHLSGLPTGRQESIKTKKLPLAVQNKPPSEDTDDYLRPVKSSSSQDTRPHIALRCLEGSTNTCSIT